MHAFNNTCFQHMHSWRRPLVSQKFDDCVLDAHTNVYIYLTIQCQKHSAGTKAVQSSLNCCKEQL